MSAYELAEELMKLDIAVSEELGIEGRPTGPARQEYIERMCAELEDQGYAPEDIPEEVTDVLEAENFHSLNTALDVYMGEADLDEIMEEEREYYSEWF